VEGSLTDWFRSNGQGSETGMSCVAAVAVNCYSEQITRESADDLSVMGCRAHMRLCHK